MFPVRKESSISGLNECPICRTHLIGDADKGEIFCPKCGFVATDQGVDPAAEWKSMDYEERRKRSRIGMPNTLSLHDYGLSTDISTDGRDSHGRSLGHMSRMEAQRMRKWQARIRTSSSGERSLSTALAKISELSDQLNLPSSIVEEASHIYRKCAKLSVAKSKSITGMAAAAIMMACRRSTVNRTLKEIAAAADITERAAAKYFRLLQMSGIDTAYVPPPPIQKYISKLVNKEKINPRVERLALEIAERTNDSEISSGKTPGGLAAAYVYIASVMSGEHIPQREIAEFGEVTEVTVRNRCREILENYSIKQKLRASND